MNVGAAQQAIDTCSQIIQSNRESDVNVGIAYFNRGNAHMSLHNAQGAAEDYTQALSHNFQQPDVYYGRGTARNALGQFAEAMTRLQCSHHGQSPTTPKRSTIAATSTKLGLHDFTHAIADYSAAIALRDDALFRYNRGHAYQYGAHDLANALVDYNRAIELNPHTPTRTSSAATSFSPKTISTPLSRDYQAALSAHPDYALAYYNLGKAYEAQGHKQDAIGQWTEAIRVNPQYVGRADLARQGQLRHPPLRVRACRFQRRHRPWPGRHRLQWPRPRLSRRAATPITPSPTSIAP